MKKFAMAAAAGLLLAASASLHAALALTLAAFGRRRPAHIQT
jgi:hypothetical protein